MMNKAVIAVVCGVTGFVAGFFTAKKLIKTNTVEKYILSEEKKDTTEEKVEEKPAEPTLERSKPSDIHVEQPSESRIYNPHTKAVHDDPIYVIKPEAFGEYDDYKTEFLTLYSDRIVADQNLDILKDIRHTIGKDFAENIGVFEQNVVHIRNEIFKVDFEVTYDCMDYRDIIPEVDPCGIRTYDRTPENAAAWAEWDAYDAEHKAQIEDEE